MNGIMLSQMVMFLAHHYVAKKITNIVKSFCTNYYMGLDDLGLDNRGISAIWYLFLSIATVKLIKIMF